MCVYCMMADHAKKWWPDPAIPNREFPWAYPVPWTRKQLDEFEDILRRIKDIEDRLGGCPCEEPEKLDYLKDIRKRLDGIERKLP